MPFSKRIFCQSNYENGKFTRIYYNIEEFMSDNTCNISGGIPSPIGFNGLIVAQGLIVPYVGPQGGDPGYDLDVKVMADTCSKKIDFKFILTTIDTSRIFEHGEDILMFLEGIDSTYTVHFSHEIIPYSE